MPRLNGIEVYFLRPSVFEEEELLESRGLDADLGVSDLFALEVHLITETVLVGWLVVDPCSRLSNGGPSRYGDPMLLVLDDKNSLSGISFRDSRWTPLSEDGANFRLARALPEDLQRARKYRAEVEKELSGEWYDAFNEFKAYRQLEYKRGVVFGIVAAILFLGFFWFLSVFL